MRMVATAYRQHLVDAAVAELRYQLDPDSVAQHGTHVQVDGSFKMARVIEAVMRVAFTENDAIIDEVAKAITPAGEEWSDWREAATDAIAGVRGSILAQLDPLP
ncbi:MAG: hypothetical protein ACTHP8_10315 [Bosea sp. (in: a-proteobacteria)]|uniref:hypothetical protein n=1 Tax=Bosea sp. (in: a-proteobacteria) TaxID=1871050 RepID=UPI003F7C8395